MITIWHQVRPAEREVLHDEIVRFETAHPDVHIRPLYKETEELRSGFQAAALAGDRAGAGLWPVRRARHVSHDGSDSGPRAVVSGRRGRRFCRRCAHLSAGGEGPGQARAGAGRRPLRQSSGPGLQPPLHQDAAQDDRRIGEAGRREHARRGRRRPPRPLRPGLEFHGAVLRGAVSHRLRGVGVPGTGVGTARRPHSIRPSPSPPIGSSSRSAKSTASSLPIATTNWPIRCSKRAVRR